jgi:hypothetical protein
MPRPSPRTNRTVLLKPERAARQAADACTAHVRQACADRGWRRCSGRRRRRGGRAGRRCPRLAQCLGCGRHPAAPPVVLAQLRGSRYRNKPSVLVKLGSLYMPEDSSAHCSTCIVGCEHSHPETIRQREDEARGPSTRNSDLRAARRPFRPHRCTALQRPRRPRGSSAHPRPPMAPPGITRPIP